MLHSVYWPVVRLGPFRYALPASQTWGLGSLIKKSKTKTARGGPALLLTALTLGLTAAIGWASDARTQVVIGGSEGPAVITDFEAIDNPFTRPGLEAALVALSDQAARF